MTNVTDIASQRKMLCLQEADKVRAMATAALDYSIALAADGGALHPSTYAAELRMLEAIRACVDDVDQQIDSCRFELGIDEEGYPTDAGDDDTYWRESAYAIERGMGQ